MFETLLPLLLILLAFYVWHAALRSRELARAISQRLCSEARVQLLDQTVALQRVGFARGSDGRLHLRRRYRFELSTDGADRHQGTLELLDGELLSHSLPLPASMSLPPTPGPVPEAYGSNVVPLRRH